MEHLSLENGFKLAYEISGNFSHFLYNVSEMAMVLTTIVLITIAIMNIRVIISLFRSFLDRFFFSRLYFGIPYQIRYHLFFYAKLLDPIIMGLCSCFSII